MFRILFITLMSLHGLIHLMGFSKAFGYTDTRQLHRPISKAAGICWLLVSILYLAAGLLLFLGRDEWWMAGVPALVLSQLLIIFNWRDARLGSFINAVIFIPLVIAFAGWQFNRQFNKVSAQVLSAVQAGDKKTITAAMLTPLPAPVQHWLEKANIVGKEKIQTVFIRQKGTMRTRPGGKPVSFNAMQYSTVDPPAFVWKARMRMNPLLYIDGLDRYVNGNGGMLVKLLSIYSVADAKGPATNQAALLRYLGELSWYPTAALSEAISWEPVDSLAAKATIHDGAQTVSGIFHFTSGGDIAGFEAMRYYDRGKKGSTLEKWTPENIRGAIREIQGMRIPYKSSVTWHLPEGDFTWLQLELVEVVYNKTR